MIFNSTQSIYAIKLMNSMLANVPYKTIIGTTLNEKWAIGPEHNNTVFGYPNVNLITIGTNNELVDTNNNALNLTAGKHKPTDAALVNHIPFYMRRSEELQTNPPSDRLRLKSILNFNGIEYVVYYGRLITDVISKEDIIEFSNIELEFVNIRKFDTITNKVLTPTGRYTTDYTNDSVNYVADFFKYYVYLSENELTELRHVFDILYPGGKAIINELALCSSRIKDIGYEECFDTQVTYFLDVNLDIDLSLTEGFLETYLEVGGMELLRQ